MLSVASLLIALLIGSLAACVAQRLSTRRQFRGLPRVGIDPGLLGLRTQAAKNEFYAQGQKLLEHGYKQYKDTPYIIQTCDTQRLVIPEKYIEELKNLPDTRLSFKEELLDRFMGQYTELNAVRGTNVHRDIVRHQLTKNLGSLLPQMKEEADLALENILRECNSKDYMSIKVCPLIFATIGQITSRRVIDEPFISRDPVWLDTIIGFTASVAIFSMTMRRIPPMLRPLAQYTLQCGRKLRADIAQVKRLLVPVIRARQRRSLDDTLDDKSGVVNGGGAGQKDIESDGPDDQPQDFVQWLSESGKGNDLQPDEIVRKILFLIVAAMHTSAITAIHAFYDICAHPKFMEELRAEAVEEVRANGWSNTSLLRLRKMESFLKESGRANSAGVVSFQRLVLAPIRLSNEFLIPAGTHICAASDARSRDPTWYESPHEFRPLRTYSPPADGHEDIDATGLFSSVAAGDSWFGAGRQACPGRWYASAQIKLVLCLLLIDYDFKYPEGQKNRSSNWVKDEKTGPDMEQMIWIKRRAAA